MPNDYILAFSPPPPPPSAPSAAGVHPCSDTRHHSRTSVPAQEGTPRTQTEMCSSLRPPPSGSVATEQGQPGWRLQTSGCSGVATTPASHPSRTQPWKQEGRVEPATGQMSVRLPVWVCGAMLCLCVAGSSPPPAPNGGVEGRGRRPGAGSVSVYHRG